MTRANVFMVAALAVAGLACKPSGPIAGADSGGEAPEAPVALAESIELPVAVDPSVAYAVWFAVGSQDDPPGKEGLAWLTANLIAEGGTTERPYAEIVDLLYPMAAGWGVRVDREMTVLTGRTHVETADDFQALFMQQWTEPAFAEADFERLRKQAKSYLETTLRYASDEELGKAGLEAFVFHGTPYAHPPSGSVAGLDAITLDDVRRFYAEHYTKDAVTFAIGGGYRPEQLAALEATADALPERAASPSPSPPAIEPFTGKHLLLIDKPGADASISFGHPIDLQRGDPDFVALWLANSWLGEHRNSSSHLYQVIREARGLNYGDYSYIEAFPGGGFRQMPPSNVGRRSQLFQIWIRTLPNEHAHFALRAAHRELVALVEQGLTEEQFELTRSFLRNYVLHFADTTAGRLGYAVDDRFYGLDHSHLDRFRSELDALTLEQVNAAIREHLDPNNLKLVIVTGEAATLAEAIVADEPGTIEYPSPKPQAVVDEDREIGAHRLGIPAQNVTVVAVDQMFAG